MVEFPEELVTILTKMGEAVGVKYEDIDFSNKDWYMQHRWTMEDQDKFQVWLTNYLYKNKKARKIFERPPTTKKACEKAAKWFLFAHGWGFK